MVKTFIEKINNLDQTKLEDQLDFEITTYPARPGDAKPFGIFQNVGLVLTRWERTECSLMELLLAFQSKTGNQNKILRKFSRIKSTQDRVNLILREFDKAKAKKPTLDDLCNHIFRALLCYLKWKIARNRVAHGMVVVAGATGVDDGENGDIQTFSLCPSQANHHAWNFPWRVAEGTDGDRYMIEGDCNDDYIFEALSFNYLSKDIFRIAHSILRLDRRIKAIARRAGYIDEDRCAQGFWEQDLSE